MTAFVPRAQVDVLGRPSGADDRSVADADAPGTDWWRDAVVYQVYLRSFADSNGDGSGDVDGLRGRLDHIRDLGVDAVWINPWYRSPMADHGYDVADHCDIDPLFGSLDQALALITEAHALGLRVILDLVANHTSDQHPWFQSALAAAPGAQERGRYHFRDGRGPGGEQPPNDWNSAFGGSAWTRTRRPDGSPGQWFLHLFAPQQPDLNWDDPGVRSDFEAIIRFWFDAGVDGLRVDAASALAKAPGLPDAGLRPSDGFAPATWTDSPLWDVESVHDIYRSWRRIADGYPEPKMFVGEVVVNGASRLARYLRPDELHMAFNLDFLKAPWDADALRRVVQSTMEALDPVQAPATWVLSSHDETRHVTRYAARDGHGGAAALEVGERRARAALLLMLALPGGAYLYQGEELGLPQVDLPDEHLQDPVFLRSGGAERGRDGCRIPLPWAGEAPPYGFTDAPRTWLPQPQDWARYGAARQHDDTASMLHLYRTAVRLRAQLRTALASEMHWLDSPSGTLAFRRRSGLTCIVNLRDEPLRCTGEVLLASAGLDDGALPPDSAAWTQEQPSD